MFVSTRCSAVATTAAAASRLLENACGNVPRATPLAGLVSQRCQRQKRCMSNVVESATFEMTPCKLHLVTSGPATSTELKRDDALRYFRDMVVIRRMESAAATLYKEKAVRGFCHLSSGQEAISVGICAAKQDVDTIITSYRAHGFTYTMGQPVLGVLAELTGRQDGCVRGKGGSMHMYAKNFYGGNGIVGAQVPLGAGIALAHKYKKDNGVCYALYGDGAAQQGQCFEAYNMAKLWNLPIVFICENNQYGMGTSLERASASSTFYDRTNYIPGLHVDGMDVLAVREATRFAINHCSVEKKGPLIYEIATYRYHGHSMSDPGTSYRSRQEIQDVRQTRDPITGFKEKIIGAGLVTVDEVKKIEVEVKRLVDLDTRKARESPEIDVAELYNDVYAANTGGDIKGLLPWEMHGHANTQQPVNL